MEKITTESKFADKNGEIMVVELGGHVDQSNSYQLQKMFDDIIHSGCYQVVVDFKELYYMSSAGWGVFIGEIKRFRDKGGDIKLAAMNADIQDVFQMLEFYHILEDYASVDEAVGSFNQNNGELNLLVSDDEAEDEKIEGVHSESEEIELPESKPTEDLRIDKDEITEVKVNDQPAASAKSAEILDFVSSQSTSRQETKTDDLKSIEQASELRLPKLPLSEKVKHIIAQNPLLGVFGIKKILKHEHFGKTRISVFRLYSLLKDMDLNSKAKRYRYYRSC